MRRPPLLTEAPAEDANAPIDTTGVLPFPVVGIGASAGGLEAFTQLLHALPEDTGMAFVLVQHLAPTHASMLSAILARATAMPVLEVHDELAVAANHVYVIPPGQDMIISQRVLKLFPRKAGAGQHRPIDSFFASLAASQGHQAIGVVLSGTANDGTLGLQEIKAAGGITFAQDTTAQQSSMPQSAIATGCVDVVLPPDEIASELARIARHPYVARSRPTVHGVAAGTAAEPDLAEIFQLLRRATNVDFSQYKVNTLVRRIARRMVLHKQEGRSDYVRFLRKDAAEVEALYQDILIGVTSFFRDPDVFEALKTNVFSRLLERSSLDAVRVWVLGCSSGEEAYSIAITFAECEEAAGTQVPLQIFASDLNATAIEKARAGVYPKTIASDVSPERLRRFFVETDGAYRVSKPIRDACVFARHNVLSDPPFSRVDIISCRNVLIYLDPALQHQILPVLHYALKPGGVLMLGGSETIGSFRDLFEAEDAAHKLYTRKPGPARLGMRFPDGIGLRQEQLASPRQGLGHAVADDILKQADRFLLAKYAPPGVVVSADLEILHVRGDTSPYLTPAQGRASLSLLKMTRPDLLIPLRAALQRAKQQKAAVREAAVQVTPNGEHRALTLEVAPVQTGAGGETGFVIGFVEEDGLGTPEPLATRSAPGIPAEQESLAREVERLTRELATTREYLQSVIEQQEAANEELQSSHEEVQSANEELQSINEELETSKEEIQSSNEELATVNDELQNRNAELGKLTNDLTNLIVSIEMSVLIITRDLHMRRFSPMAGQMLRLSPTDIGRPIRDIQLDVFVPNLEQLLTEAIDSVQATEREVQDAKGRWYSLRIRPYQTLENKIDGAVLMLVDVDTLKRAREYSESIVETVREPLVVLDGALRVVSANPAFYETFQVSGAETVRRSFDELGEGQWDIPQLRTMLEEVLPKHRVLSDVEVAHEFPTIGRRVMLLNARPLSRGHGDNERILLAIQDITERRALEDGLRTSVADLADANRHKNEFLAMLAHELRNPLAPIRNAVRLLQVADPNEELRRSAIEMIERQVTHMVRLVDDLLDVSRMSLGTIALRLERTELAAVINQAVEAAQEVCDRSGQELTVSIPPEVMYLNADPTRLTQIVTNLLVNACKFTDQRGRIWLTVEREGMDAVIRVRDDGIGIAAEQLPHVFEMFMQVDPAGGRSRSSLGIGLTLVKKLVELHGGTVRADSRGIGHGSEFVLRLPTAMPPSITPVPAPGRDETGPVTRRRILVVDDNRDAAESLAMLLRLDGHEVAIVYDGVGAVETAARMRPDVVLLDIGLPGVDGNEVARRIRLSPGGKGALLVAVSGWGRDEDRRRSADAGFDAHIVKPAELDVLTELISSAPSRAQDSDPP